MTGVQVAITGISTETWGEESLGFSVSFVGEAGMGEGHESAQMWIISYAPNVHV